MRSCLENVLLLGITLSVLIGTYNNFSELSYNDSSASLGHEQSYPFTKNSSGNKKPSSNKKLSTKKSILPDTLDLYKGFVISDVREINVSSADGEFIQYVFIQESAAFADPSTVIEELLPITSNHYEIQGKKALIRYSSINANLAKEIASLAVEIDGEEVQYFYLTNAKIID